MVGSSTSRNSPWPLGDGEFVGRIFYHRGSIVVSDSQLLAEGRRFLLNELGPLVTTRQRRTPVIATTALAVAAIVATLIAATRVSVAWSVAITVGGICIVVSAWGLALKTRRYELWSEYAGRPTLLFDSSDEIEFNKVCRALRRAADYSALSRSPDND